MELGSLPDSFDFDLTRLLERPRLFIERDVQIGESSSFVDREPSSFGGCSHSSFVDRQPSSFGGIQQSFDGTSPLFSYGRSPSIGSIQQHSWSVSIQRMPLSGQVRRRPHSFGGHRESQFSNDHVPGMSFTDVEKDEEGPVIIDLVPPERFKVVHLSSSSKRHRFVVEPLFTMKRFDQYVHAPNQDLLAQFAKSHYDEENIYAIIHPPLKQQIIDPESFKIFSETAFKCVKDQRAQRPNIDQILRNLEQALHIQNKLDNPPLVANENEGTSYNPLECLSIGSNGEKNYLISAKIFSYENRWVRNWRQIPQFEKVVEMLTISNLKIKIKIKTQFLSPLVNYGVHLVFKFCGPRKFSSNSTYVNLTYKLGNEKFHAYFATWRDEEWMMIELCRFFNHGSDTHFEVLLDCFSRCYCGSGAVYIEGIEFRAIDNVSLQTDLDNMLQRTTENDGEPGEVFSLKEVDGNELMLSAKEVLYNSTNVKVFNQMQPSGESRLSEKCNGLHCPVKVRDVLHWKNKAIGIVYFRSPKPWNLHDKIRIPKAREDGWMEVMVWMFNSSSELRNESVPMNLKLITYEGTMSGLLVCGLEIRPM